MVAQLNPPTAPDMTRADVVAWVQDKIDNDNLGPNAAINAVYEQIVANGQLLDLAALHGHQLVGMLWRAWNIDNRPAAVARTIAKPLQPAVLAATGGLITQAPPRPRVVDPDALKSTSLMDGLYKIEGSWIRVGDMTRPICLKVFDLYRKSALACEHNARHFRAVAENLQDGERVEDKFSETDLMRLFRIAKPITKQIPAEVLTP